MRKNVSEYEMYLENKITDALSLLKNNKKEEALKLLDCVNTKINKSYE